MDAVVVEGAVNERLQKDEVVRESGNESVKLVADHPEVFVVPITRLTSSWWVQKELQSLKKAKLK